MPTRSFCKVAHQNVTRQKSSVSIGSLQDSLRAALRTPTKQSEKSTDTRTDTGRALPRLARLVFARMDIRISQKSRHATSPRNARICTPANHLNRRGFAPKPIQERIGVRNLSYGCPPVRQNEWASQGTSMCFPAPSNASSSLRLSHHPPRN